METSRYRRAERDGIAPTQQSGEGWPQHRRLEMDCLALVPPNGEGWKRPDTVERRGMGSHWHFRVEMDGIAPALQSGDG